MNLAHIQQRKLFQSILRVVATSLRVCVHKMYEREHRRWQAQVGRSGGMLPRENFEKIGAIRCLLAHFHAVYFLFRKHHFSTGKGIKF